MSIVGLGTDLVAVARVADLLARHGDRFLVRCYGPGERESIAGRAPGERAAAAAARWAAKEAFLKALGGPIRHIPYQAVVVVTGPDGQPGLALSGVAETALAERGGRRVHVSLSHERDFALATVLLEG